MKHMIVKWLCLAVLSLGLSAVTQAQQENGPGKHLDKLKQELGLTDAQVSQLQPILENQHKDVLAVRENKALSKDEKHQQIKAIEEKYHSQIAAVLTPDQQAKWKELKAQHHGEQKQASPQGSAGSQ